MFKEKYNKALDIIKVVAKSKWGANNYTLFNLYRSLFQSELDYDCMIHGSARTSYLKAFYVTQHQGLWLCL